MKLAHVFGIAGLLTLIAVSLGSIRSDLPVMQYLGNTTGVLLGFVLGVWWQETEKERVRKEQQMESERIRKETIDQFWAEYKSFLFELEKQANALKIQTQAPTSLYDTLIEFRLPLPEALYFQKQAAEISLGRELRQEIAQLVKQMRILDEYIDFGADKLIRLHGHFLPVMTSLWDGVRNLNVKYSGKTAV